MYNGELLGINNEHNVYYTTICTINKEKSISKNAAYKNL